LDLVVVHGCGKHSGAALPICCIIALEPDTMRKNTEHRIRAAASLARPGWTWVAALAMNAPSVLGAGVIGWFAFTADEPTLAALAGVLFVMALIWALLVTMNSWRMLRRFTRREAARRP